MKEKSKSKNSIFYEPVVSVRKCEDKFLRTRVQLNMLILLIWKILNYRLQQYENCALCSFLLKAINVQNGREKIILYNYK